MKKISDPEHDCEEILKVIEKHDLILDEENSDTNRPHLLSALIQAKTTGLGPPVLWLDGDNSFNPYRISELVRNLGLHSEKALQETYISRAFTCYQMMSLIFDRLEEAIENFGPGFIVATGLPELFSEADLPEKEALKAFMPVVESLESFQNKDPTIYLTTRIDEENEFVLELESIADKIIGSEKRESSSGDGSGSFHPLARRNNSPQTTAKTPSLEEFDRGAQRG